MNIVNKERHYGIDLLKITAMLMIVIIHTNIHGGILTSEHFSYTQQNFFYSNYSVIWFIQLTVSCAVNCYALITGYFNWNQNIRYYKLVMFWLQIVFYMVIVALVYSIITASIDHVVWFNAFFPIMTYQYWYMTAYVGVFLLMPILNSYIQNTSVSKLRLHLLFLFIMMSVIPLFFSRNGDPFVFNSGYSTFWLVMMYIAGGIISKCDLGKSLSKLQYFIYFLMMALISWGYKMVVDYFNIYAQANITSFRLFEYRSPTFVLAAVFLLLLFKQIKINKGFMQKAILLLSNATLGVYLIHEQPLIRYNIIRGYSKDFVALPIPQMVGMILLGALTIYIVCTLIELIRMQLFKFLNVANGLRNIEEKITALWEKSHTKI